MSLAVLLIRVVLSLYLASDGLSRFAVVALRVTSRKHDDYPFSQERWEAQGVTLRLVTGSLLIASALVVCPMFTLA